MYRLERRALPGVEKANQSKTRMPERDKEKGAKLFTSRLFWF